MSDPSSSRSSRRVALRQRVGAAAVDYGLRGLSQIGHVLPVTRQLKHGVDVIKDLSYRRTGLAAHRLDIFRPQQTAPPWPVVVYIHGGGFRILSKDTLWMMGYSFAQQGYLVVSINYRLAPRHPFPAALEDSAHALAWVRDNAAKYGGDLDRLVFAGESAGGNLATCLTLAACAPRPEAWAQQVFELGLTPRATLAACGYLQVSAPERLTKNPKLAPWIADRIGHVSHAYLGTSLYEGPGGQEMADPVCLLEGDLDVTRPLPPFFAPVGTRDPLLDDTRRLAAALERRGVRCDAHYYKGEVHAFHAFLWREQAQQCWRDTFAFLDDVVPSGAP